MKHYFSILTMFFAVFAFLISCGGSEGSKGTGGSNWGNSDESGYGGSSGGNGSGGYNDNNDKDLKFEILDMNGNPITALEIQEGSERVGFQLYNGTGQSVSWHVNKGVNFCTSYDGMDLVYYIESVNPPSGMLEPGMSASVVLSINPLVYSYKVSEPAYIVVAANGESYKLSLIFPNTEIPECSSTNSAFCKDSSSGLMWSAKGDRAYFNWNVWDFAYDWCDGVIHEGRSYIDWHLPTIDELRTLIQNCPSTEPGGSCPVSESRGMLSQEYAEQCTGCGKGGFSKLGDRDNLWSSSDVSGDSSYAWFMSFSTGAISAGPKEDFALFGDGQPMGVRCVRSLRCAEGKYKCWSSYSHYCSDGNWKLSEDCSKGCDESTGRCKSSSGGENTPECTSGQYKCGGYYSYYCSDGKWKSDEYCSNGCDSSTGKCKNASGGSGSEDGGNSTECTSGQYKCENDYSYNCTGGKWDFDEYCLNGCDSSTGKCKNTSGGGGNSGNSGDCSDIYDCYYECEDSSCVYSCIGAGSSSAQSQFWDLLDCWEDNSCEYTDCDECYSKYSACVE